jgi:hypothetical protein
MRRRTGWASVGSSEPIGSGGRSRNNSADEGTSQAANFEPLPLGHRLGYQEDRLFSAAPRHAQRPIQAFNRRLVQPRSRIGRRRREAGQELLRPPRRVPPRLDQGGWQCLDRPKRGRRRRSAGKPCARGRDQLAGMPRDVAYGRVSREGTRGRRLSGRPQRAAPALTVKRPPAAWRPLRCSTSLPTGRRRSCHRAQDAPVERSARPGW